MLKGTELEPAARAAYEARTGLVMQPLVLVDGEYSASLDGLTLGGERLVEIKCPYKGRDSTLWKSVEAGELPEHYRWQVQHQLMVTGAEVADVFVFDGTEGIFSPGRAGPEHLGRRSAAPGTSSRRYVEKAEPPPLTERDVRVRDDRRVAAGGADVPRASALRTTSWQGRGRGEGQRWSASPRHAKEQGGGVSVTRLWKRGNIDYKRVPELRGVDLEPYRQSGREETRITTT